MFSTLPSRNLRNDTSSYVQTNDVIFICIMGVLSAIMFYCLTQSSSMLLVFAAIPLCLYDRRYVFPMLLTIALCQGAFEEAEVTQTSATQSTDFSETLILAAVAPMLFYDMVNERMSRMAPFRFVIFYLIFLYFVVQGVFVYYQYPQNYQSLLAIHAKWAPVLHSIMKAIKIVFYIFYLRVLVNNPIKKNLDTLEMTRRFVPFMLIVLGLNLALNGRTQSGAGYQDTLQLGDAHHGSYTAQLCALSIYCFLTFFMKKTSLVTKGWALVAIASVGYTIMEMGSRNGLLSFALVCLIGFAVNMKGKSWSYITIWSLTAFCGAVLVVIISLSSPTVQRAIYMTDQGGGDRVYYWEAGAKQLSIHPLMGMGGDESASQATVAEFTPAGVQDKVMHNTYLEIAVEYGLVALIFYLVLLFTALMWGYRLYKLAIKTGNLLIAAPPISYLLLMIAACFVSDVWDTSIWYNLSMIFALSIQLVYKEHLSKRNKINKNLTLGEAVAV